ncbi:hypothetical protein ACQPXM_12885 [Kribbella sp. CA-253562]|uniref:hypothetical protein n=1 Tax=Kribbella sp. CA-253562 TaxID=3239942 RepID=UPI003D8D9541
MASNLDCLGLGVDSPEAFADLVERIGPHAAVVGAGADGVELLRWEDPSGARLLLTRGKRGIVRVTPSYGGERVVQLGDIQRESDEAAVADVVQDGETVTRLAVELEELPLLGDAKHAGAASIVALAPDAQFFRDRVAFAASDASRLSTGEPGPRPDHYEPDWVWPPRMADESFIPTGMFGGDVQPLALLNGVVPSAERRTTMLTGQEFVVARVRTAGFEADVCLPGGVAVPVPGVVLSAEVFLTGSVEVEFPVGRRRWFSRR